MSSQGEIGEETRLLTNQGPSYMAERAAIDVFESVVTDDDQDEEEEDIRLLRHARLEHKEMAWYLRPSLAYIAITLAFFVLSFAVGVSPKMILLLDKVCQHIAVDGYCKPAEQQQVVSQMESVIVLLNGIMGALLSGKLGELSDRYGRKPILMYVGIVFSIGQIVLTYFYLPGTPFSYYGIVFCCFIESCSGGVFALLAASNSYISDIVEPEKRTVSIGLLMSILYGSMGLGPLFGSWLIKFTNTTLSAMYASIVLVLMFILMVCVIPESRHEHARRKSISRRTSMLSLRANAGQNPLWRVLNLFSPIKKLWLPPTKRGCLIPRQNVLILISIDILFLCLTQASIPPLKLYATFKFNWKAVDLGYLLSVAGLGRAFLLLIVSPIVLHYLKKRFLVLSDSVDRVDVVTIRYSLIFGVLSLTLVLVINQAYSLYLCMGLQAMGALISPTIQSSVIKYGSANSIGEMFGAMSLVRNLTMLVFPSFLLVIYGKTVGTNPTLFLVIPIVCGICAVVLSFFLKIVEDHDLLRRNSEASSRDVLGQSSTTSKR